MSGADPGARGHGQQSGIQSLRRAVQEPTYKLLVEGGLPSCDLSDLRRDSGVLLGFHPDRRSNRWSIAPAAHGGMVPLQHDGHAGLRDHRGTSGRRYHNRLLSQRGDGYADDGPHVGRLFPIGDLGAQHHLD